MSYTGHDRSANSGKPCHFYFFQGTLKNYRYTDQPTKETLEGHIYLPLQISSTNIEVGSVVESIKTTNVVFPDDTDIATDYGGDLTPAELFVTIYRAYRGDDWATQFRQRFKGISSNYGRVGRQFQIIFKNNVQSELQVNTRDVYAQGLCNHILYDARCKANKSDHTASATVTGVGKYAITVDDDHFANQELVPGSITNARTGEVRLIFKNQANVIDIGYPFIDIKIGDTVNLTQGCSRGSSMCINRFDNLNNYGGQLWMPATNPFIDGIS